MTYYRRREAWRKMDKQNNQTTEVAVKADTFDKLDHLKRINGQTRDEFIAFLESTLIPDLYESGHDFTARDFETAVAWMKGGK